MNARKLLHDLVEKLPEAELATAARILIALEAPADPLRLLLMNAPEDDEPFDPSVIDSHEEGLRVAHDEVLRRGQ